MPLEIGFRGPIPSSSRKLGPLPRRISSVEKTIDFVEDFINLESEEDNKSSSRNQIVLAAKVHLLALEHLIQTSKVTINLIFNKMGVFWENENFKRDPTIQRG